MLQIDTITKNKNTFNPNKELQQNNIGIWDLTRSSMNFRNINLKIDRYFTVREEFQMRPDQLAFQSFGDLAYTGSLLKINGISNPFALKEGILFIVPKKDRIDAAFEQKKASLLKSDTDTNPNKNFRDAQEQKKFKVSSSRQAYLEKKNQAKNPPQQILPPNILQEGERQTLRTNAVIAFGPDVSNATPNPAGNINGNP
jgi:hypothetical protein